MDLFTFRLDVFQGEADPALWLSIIVCICSNEFVTVLYVIKTTDLYLYSLKFYLFIYCENVKKYFSTYI